MLLMYPQIDPYTQATSATGISPRNWKLLDAMHREHDKKLVFSYADI